MVSAVPYVMATQIQRPVHILLTSDAPFEFYRSNEALIELFRNKLALTPKNIDMTMQSMLKEIVPRTTDDTTLIGIYVS